MDKEEHHSVEGGFGVDVEGDQGASEGEEVDRELVYTVRASFSCRRVRFDPRVKREEYIRRLEAVMRVCDRIAANPDAYEKLQVRALEVMIKAVRACYGLVGDVEVEMIEQEVEELKRKEAEHGILGYKLPDPAQ
ncbi:MAG: hypothetical protein NWE89_01195 [Candidatus Bathyarchaeota archaeon]|nr:hypothetical protein [Candidatus Bathyarchaeota archaeon]